MAIILPGGFNITNNEPVDARITLADQTARYALSSANVYEGLIVFQQDSNTLWVLTDTTNVGNPNGWTQLQIGSVSSNLPNGVISGSSQLSGTTITDLTITNLTTVNQTSSIVFSSGSNRFGDFGNDTHEFTGSVQISGSLTTIGTVTATSISGAIAATNGLVSGSSQVNIYDLQNFSTFNDAISGDINGKEEVASATHTLVSGSSQIITANSVTLGTHTTGNYVEAISGSANQITVAGSGLESAVVTLSLPQNIHTSADTQFNSLGIGTPASTTTGEIRATGDITAFYSSDIRLKENIQPIENALEKVESISGNTYDWKDGYDEIHSHKGNDVGVIAQEIEQILPQIVTNRDNGYKAVQYEKIIPLLIEAIKELSNKVKVLENK